MFWKASNNSEKNQITADSWPNHDGWGPDTYWGCLDWVEWHKLMAQKFGKEKADKIWASEYDKASWGAHEISCSTRNDEFKSYVKKQGLDKKSSILTRVYRAEGTLDSIGEPIRDAGAAAANTAKILKYAIPATIAMVAIGLITYGYLKYIKPEIK